MISWVINLIIAISLITILALGFYAYRTSSQASTLRSEVATLSKDLEESAKAVHELSASIDVLNKDINSSNESFETYIVQLEEDNKSISILKRKLENVENQEANRCINRIVVPDDILEQLFTKDPEGVHNKN